MPVIMELRQSCCNILLVTLALSVCISISYSVEESIPPHCGNVSCKAGEVCAMQNGISGARARCVRPRSCDLMCPEGHQCLMQGATPICVKQTSQLLPNTNALPAKVGMRGQRRFCRQVQCDDGEMCVPNLFGRTIVPVCVPIQQESLDVLTRKRRTGTKSKSKSYTRKSPATPAPADPVSQCIELGSGSGSGSGSGISEIATEDPDSSRSKSTPRKTKSGTPKSRTPKSRTPKSRTPKSRTTKSRTTKSRTTKSRTAKSRTAKSRSSKSRSTKGTRPRNP